MVVIGVDQSITGTGVVVIDTSKDIKSGEYIIHSEIISVPSEIIKFCKLYELPISETKPYKADLIDEQGKPKAKKAGERTKADKALFKVSTETRIWTITKTIDKIIRTHNPEMLLLEGIAFSGSGMVATLGRLSGYIEATAKANRLDLHIVVATTLKKFATGVGNADKEMMYHAIDDAIIPPLLDHIPEKSENDVVDAYHLARYSEVVETFKGIS